MHPQAGELGGDLAAETAVGARDQGDRLRLPGGGAVRPDAYVTDCNIKPIDAATPPPPATTRVRQVRRTRANTIAAVRRQLIDGGYHQLSLERVAVDAGTTRMTIYRQFGTKLGLLEAVADDLADRADVAARVEGAASIADAPAAFVALIGESCRFWGTDPALLRRLVSLAAVDPEAGSLIANRERWRYQHLAQITGRLAVERRISAQFTEPHAVATIAAVTCFPTCDELATRLSIEHASLTPLIRKLLASVIVA